MDNLLKVQRTRNSEKKEKSFWLVHNVPDDLFYKNKKSYSCMNRVTSVLDLELFCSRTIQSNYKEHN